MRTLLDEHFAPITSSIGFLELPIADAAAGLGEWRRAHYRVSVTRPVDEFPEVLHHLEPLTSGARPRELLVSVGKWTAYFDNSLRGTDAVSTIGYLSRTLRCQGLAIRSVPRTVGLPGVKKGRAGSVQFELFGPLRTDFLNYVRTVGVTFDGSKWVFNVSGVVQDFEEIETYAARRVRDRFTSDILERYCLALGLDVFNPVVYGPEAVFFESTVIIPSQGLVMTLAEAQQWLEINPGMAEQLPG